MKDVLSIAGAHIATAIRERVTLFWFLIFPVFLLTVLTLIFGQVGGEGEITFEITLLDRDVPRSGDSIAATIEAVFRQLSTAPDAQTQPLFVLHTPGENVDPAQFLESELTELRRGKRAALVVIPAGFSDLDQ